MKQALDRLTDVPVDIEPLFPVGEVSSSVQSTKH